MSLLATAVFVYGTLRRGGALHAHLAASKFVGEAVVPHYAMYDLGAFPACALQPVTATPTPRVRGEVYEVDAATLARLDRVESVPKFYAREEVLAYLGGRPVAVYMYTMPARRLAGEPPVPSGDWMEYAAQRVAS